MEYKEIADELRSQRGVRWSRRGPAAHPRRLPQPSCAFLPRGRGRGAVRIVFEEAGRSRSTEPTALGEGHPEKLDEAL